eukprot:6841968-Pyramimonas_sp.AAC.1
MSRRQSQAATRAVAFAVRLQLVAGRPPPPGGGASAGDTGKSNPPEGVSEQGAPSANSPPADSRVRPVWWSDGYFSLAPGEEAEVVGRALSVDVRRARARTAAARGVLRLLLPDDDNNGTQKAHAGGESGTTT